MPLFTSCFCCSLKTGMVVAGLYTLVFGCLSLATSVLGWVFKEHVKEYIQGELVGNSTITSVSVSVDDVKEVVQFSCLGSGVWAIVWIIGSLIFIIGSVKEWRCTLITWMVFLWCGILVALGILALLLWVHSSFKIDSFSIWTYIMVGIGVVVFNIYLFVCVLSYYQLLQEEEEVNPFAYEMSVNRMK